MNPTLVRVGGHNLVSYQCSNDYVFKAEDDGIVEEVNLGKKYIKIRYANGKKNIIDFTQRNVRSPDGFYININLEIAKDKLSEGTRFKKNDILAADKNFFSLNGNDTELMQGTIAKIALASTEETYEDSIVMSSKLAEKLEARMTMATTLSLSQSANLLSIVKVGDFINTSDSLATFEQVLEADESILKVLSKLDDGTKDLISEGGINSKTSKYTGEIVNIVIHYNKDIEEYSPSLKKLIKAYIKEHQERSELLKDVSQDQFIYSHYTGKNESGRAKTEEFDGILIEFYTTIKVPAGVGDKFSMSTALKSINGNTYLENEEPLSDFRPENSIDYCLSPLSFVSRMTTDFHHQIYCNKVLMELRFRALELYFK